MLAIAYAVVAFVRDRLGVDDDAPWVLRADLAVLVAAVVAYLGLHGALARSEFAAPDAAVRAARPRHRAGAARRDPPRLDVARAAGGARRLLLRRAWHALHFTLETGTVAVGAEIAIYLLFVALPFVLTAAQPAVWRRAAGGWLTSALIGPALFVLFRAAWVEYWGTGAIGLLPVILAAGSVISLAGVSRIFSADEAAGDPEAAARRLNYMALFAAIALGFVAAAISVQFEKQWLTIGLALEAAAVFWLFGLVPHPGLKYFGLILFGVVGARLIVNPEVLRYEPRGAPIVNWLLYTYGVPVLATFAGAWLLRRAEARRGDDPEYDWTAGDRTLIAPVVAALGLILLFVLINVEIADYFSQGAYLQFDSTPRLERDLAYSIAWGLYSLMLLGLGIWRGIKGLRAGRAGLSDADGRQGVPVRSVGVEGDLPGAVVPRAGHRADPGLPALPALRRQETAMTLPRARVRSRSSPSSSRPAWRSRPRCRTARTPPAPPGGIGGRSCSPTAPGRTASWRSRSRPRWPSAASPASPISASCRTRAARCPTCSTSTCRGRPSAGAAAASSRRRSSGAGCRRGSSTSRPPPRSIASSSTSTAPTSASASIVETSLDGAQWTRVGGEAWVFDRPWRGRRIHDTAIEQAAPLTARYVRLTVDDWRSTPVVVRGVTAVLTTHLGGRRWTREAALVRLDTPAGQPSRYRIDAPAGAPVERIAIATDDVAFWRDVRVFEAGPRGDVAPVSERETIYRVRLDDADLDAERLDVDLVRPVAAPLIVEIDDGDSPPLAHARVTLSGMERRALVPATAAAADALLRQRRDAPAGLRHRSAAHAAVAGRALSAVRRSGRRRPTRASRRSPRWRSSRRAARSPTRRSGRCRGSCASAAATTSTR